jgi:hypothetical protein
VWRFPGAIGVVTALALCWPSAGQEKVGPERLAALVNQLGSSSFAEREQATRALDHLGAPALEALRRAAGNNTNEEIRRRAEGLVRRIERRLATAPARTPAQVRLVYKDTPLVEALADLRKKTGLTLNLDGALPVGRTLTLDTGKVPLWEAFDLFCRKAGLCEVDDAPSAPAPPARGGISVTIGGRVGGVQPLSVLGKLPTEEPIPLKLRAGEPGTVPTHLAGPVRVRALPAAAAPVVPGKPGELGLNLDLTVEPGLRFLEVVGVYVGRAIDDRGQRLKGRFSPPKPEASPLQIRGVVRINGRIFTPPETLPARPSRLVHLHFAAGARPSESFKELSGSLLAHVQAPAEDLVSIPNVLGAAGKKFAGAKGAWVRVVEVRRDEGGSVTVRLEAATPPVRLGDGSKVEEPFPGLLINGRPVGEPERLLSDHQLRLLDAKGQPLRATRAVYTGKHTAVSQEYELTYSRSTDAGEVGEAARLVYRDRPSTIVEVPFNFKGVPLR